MKIPDSDLFKSFPDIFKPDVRMSFFSRDLCKSLEEFHSHISSVQLLEYVEADVIREFEKAKNVTLYSFYAYPLGSLAITHAYSCIEKAIYLKAKRLSLLRTSTSKDSGFLPEWAGLNKKIKFALDRKWIGRKHFFLYDSQESEYTEKNFKDILEGWISFRNSLSHNPSFLTMPFHIPDKLQQFANIINAVSFGDEIVNQSVPEIHLPKKNIKVSSLMMIMMNQTHKLQFSPLNKS